MAGEGVKYVPDREDSQRPRGEGKPDTFWGVEVCSSCLEHKELSRRSGWGQVTCQPGECGLCPEDTEIMEESKQGSDMFFGINSLCCPIKVMGGEPGD